MANHPNDVPSEWLTDISTSSMVPATTTASQPDKSTKSDKIVLNPRKRSRAYDTKPGGPEDTGNYISKYLHQAMQEKDNKRKRLLEKEKRKEERERESKEAEKMAATKKDTGLNKMPKGKATVKDTRDLDTCPICMQSYQKVGFAMGDWWLAHA